MLRRNPMVVLAISVFVALGVGATVNACSSEGTSEQEQFVNEHFESLKYSCEAGLLHSYWGGQAFTSVLVADCDQAIAALNGNGESIAPPTTEQG